MAERETAARRQHRLMAETAQRLLDEPYNFSVRVILGRSDHLGQLKSGPERNHDENAYFA